MRKSSPPPTPRASRWWPPACATSATDGRTASASTLDDPVCVLHRSCPVEVRRDLLGSLAHWPSLMYWQARFACCRPCPTCLRPSGDVHKTKLARDQTQSRYIVLLS